MEKEHEKLELFSWTRMFNNINQHKMRESTWTIFFCVFLLYFFSDMKWFHWEVMFMNIKTFIRSLSWMFTSWTFESFSLKKSIKINFLFFSTLIFPGKNDRDPSLATPFVLHSVADVVCSNTLKTFWIVFLHLQLRTPEKWSFDCF